MQVAETFLPIIHLVFSNLKTWLRGTPTYDELYAAKSRPTLLPTEPTFPRYYFISGLPRAGSMLLVTILNQNPRFSVGMAGPLAGLFNILLRP